MHSRILIRSVLLGLTLICVGAAPALLAQSPALVISDATVPVETDGGVGIVAFTVSFVDSTPHGNVTVIYSTTGGTATAADDCDDPGADYHGANNIGLTFNASDRTKQIEIPVCGDPRDEPDETFFVNLSSASGGAAIQDAQGQATLIDDDDAPSLRVSDVTVAEGNDAVFTVYLSPASENSINVSYATANRTASAGSCGTDGADYATRSGSLSFAAGQTSQTLTVSVCGDAVGEAEERFDLRLSNPSNATLRDGTGVATITNGLPVLGLTPTVALTEGDDGTLNASFTVSVQGSNGSPVGVSYATSNLRGPNTATSGSCGTGGADYRTTSGTLFFTSTQPQTVSVPVCGDELHESDEPFQMRLSNPTNGDILGAVGIATIKNDDPLGVRDNGISGPVGASPSTLSVAPTLSITENISVAEPTIATFSTNAVFPVTVTGLITDPVTVSYATASGSAHAARCTSTRRPGDYESTTGTLTFTSTGPTTRNISVRICRDPADPGETFTVTLSNASNALIASATGTATIQ
jgi:hypothetical protein